MGSKLYVYIDESGDLGKFGSDYFTIAALFTQKPKPIENLIKRVRIRKLKKRIRELSEIKANNSDPVIRRYVLKKLLNQDCTFNIITITKEQVRSYLYDKKHKLYNYIIGLLIKNSEIYSNDIDLIIDKKDNNVLLQKDLNEYIVKQIQEKKLLFKVKIRHLESHCCKCLQATDFVAWSTNRKFSFGEDEYYNIIEPKISYFEKLWR